jgi:hypothetical protein
MTSDLQKNSNKQINAVENQVSNVEEILQGNGNYEKSNIKKC